MATASLQKTLVLLIAALVWGRRIFRLRFPDRLRQAAPRFTLALGGPGSSIPEDGTHQLRQTRKIRRDAWSLYVEADGRQVFVRRIRESGRLVAFLPYHVSNGLRSRVIYDVERRVFHSV